MSAGVRFAMLGAGRSAIFLMSVRMFRRRMSVARNGVPRGEELVVHDPAVFLPRSFLHAGVLFYIEIGQMLEGRREAGIPARLRRVTVAGDFADHLPGPTPRIGERQLRVHAQLHAPVASPEAVAHHERLATAGRDAEARERGAPVVDLGVAGAQSAQGRASGRVGQFLLRHGVL